MKKVRNECDKMEKRVNEDVFEHYDLLCYGEAVLSVAKIEIKC